MALTSDPLDPGTQPALDRRLFLRRMGTGIGAIGGSFAAVS